MMMKRRFEKGNRNAMTHHETEKQRENDVLTLGIIFEPLAIRPRSHLSRCRTSASASDVSFICRKKKCCDDNMMITCMTFVSTSRVIESVWV
jgi:hypothetical protein